MLANFWSKDRCACRQLEILESQILPRVGKQARAIADRPPTFNSSFRSGSISSSPTEHAQALATIIVFECIIVGDTVNLDDKESTRRSVLARRVLTGIESVIRLRGSDGFTPRQLPARTPRGIHRLEKTAGDASDRRAAMEQVNRFSRAAPVGEMRKTTIALIVGLRPVRRRAPG